MNPEKQAGNVVKFRPPVRNKRVWASVERDGEKVIEEAFDEAFKRDPKQERPWVVVVDGHPHQLRMIERVASKKQARISIVMDFIHVLEYLWKAAHNLHSGFPIASGVIEGACRHLINDRLDITGARWSLKGAEAILKLRSINSSGDWKEYWSYHRSRSEKRNYGELVVNKA